MNRPELIKYIAEYASLSNKEASDALDVALLGIARALEEGGEVRLPEFGIFTVVDRPAHEGRNPATGAAVSIAAKRKTRFKEAKALKERLNPVRLTGARRRA